MERISAYYSKELKSWVRMTREHDGEYCHTSGYATRDEAIGLPPVVAKRRGFSESGLPDFLTPRSENQ